MKKTILFAAAAALILASCGKNEVFVPVQEDIPVGFSNYAPRAISKANGSLVNSGTLGANSQIGVYGYSTADANLASNFTTKPEFMTDASVTYASTSATATASNPVRYWPKTITNLLSFYAYYPRESARISGKPTASTTGMGTLTFAQADTVATMEDFMISNIANDQYYFKEGDTAPESVNNNGVKAVNGVVPLVFRHMLTKVNFKFRTVSDYSANDVAIKVISAKIVKLDSVGVFTPKYTAGSAGSLGTTDFTCDSSDPHKKDLWIPFSDTLTLNTTATLNKADTIKCTDFLFVPQTLSDDVKVTINYIIDQNGTKTENTATVQLNQVKNSSDAAITKWNINDFVTYIFSIGLKEIKFTGTATNWDAVIEGNYVIE